MTGVQTCALPISHKLDPYRPLDRIAEGKPLPAGTKPLVVEVVALDWKWLFIYPEQGIATLNELAAPVDRPVEFRITASTVMNSFYVPALAGQIYAMPAMQTTLHAVINAPGVYDGFSANFSGDGFSHMRFKFHGMAGGDFDSWVAKAGKAEAKLDGGLYQQLEKPSEREAVRYYGSVDAGLFKRIVNRCVDPAQMCMDRMMAIDANGGHAAHAKAQASGASHGAGTHGDKTAADAHTLKAVPAMPHGDHAPEAPRAASAAAAHR